MTNVGLGVLEIPKQTVKRAVDTGHPYGYLGVFSAASVPSRCGNSPGSMKS